MKTCYVCKVEKLEEEFNKTKSSKDGLQFECRSCNKEKSKEYYYKNKQKIIKTNIKYRKKQAQENRIIIIEHYKKNPCVDCGEKDILVLELDHLRNKDRNVSEGAHIGWSKKRLLDEIAKCEVRCANCHRRKTAKEQRWFKWLNQHNQQLGD